MPLPSTASGLCRRSSAKLECRSEQDGVSDGASALGACWSADLVLVTETSFDFILEQTLLSLRIRLHESSEDPPDEGAKWTGSAELHRPGVCASLSIRRKRMCRDCAHGPGRLHVFHDHSAPRFPFPHDRDDAHGNAPHPETDQVASPLAHRQGIRLVLPDSGIDQVGRGRVGKKRERVFGWHVESRTLRKPGLWHPAMLRDEPTHR